VLADELAARLGELGFEAVKGGDPKVTRILEQAKSPQQAAKQLGAGFLIEAHLAPQTIEQPTGKPRCQRAQQRRRWLRSSSASTHRSR